MSGGVSRVYRWSDEATAPMSLDAIRERHVPAKAYRISPMRYPHGTRFGGLSRSGRVYVLAGACRYEWDAISVVLEAGFYADFPEGKYEFEVIGDADVELVNVWDLDALFEGWRLARERGEV